MEPGTEEKLGMRSHLWTESVGGCWAGGVSATQRHRSHQDPSEHYPIKGPEYISRESRYLQRIEKVRGRLWTEEGST